jgi:hypothetical protein
MIKANVINIVPQVYSIKKHPALQLGTNEIANLETSFEPFVSDKSGSITSQLVRATPSLRSP